MTTFVVNSVADGTDAAIGNGICATSTGACTLRAAVQEANAQSRPDRDRPRHGPALRAVDQRGLRGRVGERLDLRCSGQVTIVGHGSTVDAAGLDRVIEVVGSGALALRDATITGGVAEFGGGIRVNLGTTTQISDSTITGNVANGFTQVKGSTAGLQLRARGDR